MSELTGRIGSAWDIWLRNGERYSNLLPLLPELVKDTEATRRGLRHNQQHREVSRLASDLYALLRTVTRRIGRHDLSFLVADRALHAAEAADDPIRLAVARWNIGHTLLLADEYDAAIEMAELATAALPTGTSAEPETVSLAGALQLVAAVAEARAGRTWAARERLNNLHRHAELARDAGNVGNTMFGPLNIGLHGLSIELEAGDATEALRLADRIDAAGCQSVERRFTFVLDLARAYALRREETGTLLHLLEAERIAPEDLARDRHSHGLVRNLLRSSRRSHRSQAAALATRLHIEV
ncbi:hypothetical protein [Nocardia sp. NPDC019395]|uniref:hypothetical protein n=1 Tax=Nocardia sp. NPDC019395 TaxID=3154686 RepID=UPI0033E854F6